MDRTTADNQPAEAFNGDLEAFFAGQLELDDLLARLDQRLHAQPAQLGEIAGLIESAFHAGRIPPQIHGVLRQLLTQHMGPSAPEEDETRLRPPPTPGQAITAPPPVRPVGAQHGRPAIGDLLNHRFVLKDEIGRGGMGIVYKALDLRKEEARDRDPYVAVKVLNAEFSQIPEAFIALQRECKKAQRLAHPNIATVYDFDRDQDTVYMTMELLEGESVEHLLKRLQPGALPFKQALPIITGMAEGLAYAHEQGIVHSDFKPGNAFILTQGRVKVLDFGIARAVTRPGQTASDATVFKPSWEALTPAYASCEMFDQAPPDPRDDIYALACTAYELLAGHHPFEWMPANQARGQKRTPAPIPGLSQRQNQALAHALAFDRNLRTPSARQFLNELTATGGIMSKTVLAWGAGILLALAVILGSVYYLTRPAPKGPATQTGRAPLQGQEPQGEPSDSSSTPPTPAATPTPAVTPTPALDPETRAKIERILNMADLHYQIGRLTEPAGSNAYAAYQAVLELQPDNQRALQGLRKIADHYLQQVREKVAQGQLKPALSDVEYALKLFPRDGRLLREKDRISAQIDSR